MKPLSRSVLVHLYPARWRRRYGDEFRAVLDDEPLGPRLVMDVLVGAISAHITYTTEEPIMSARRLRMPSALLAVVAIFPAMLVVGALLARGFLRPYQAARLSFLLGDPRVFVPVVIGVGVTVVLGVFAIATELRSDRTLRDDVVLFRDGAPRLLRRPALLVGSFAIFCAVIAIIAIPLLLAAPDR